jgi:Flp pilus assembly protein TadD
LRPELAREICERNTAQAVLHGALSKIGGKYLLMLDAESCVSGKHIAADKIEAASKEEVLSALDKAAGDVRRQLGESAASLQRFQIPIAQVTTSSLEALRAYSQGRNLLDHGDWASAEKMLKQAVALDPNFASAYSALGSAYYNRNDLGQAASNFKKPSICATVLRNTNA